MVHDQVISFVAFLLRHFIASIDSLAVPILLVIVAFITLIIIAIVGNFGLGSPFALPLWVAATGIVSLFYTAFLLFPAVLIAEQVFPKFHARQLLAQAVITSITLAVLVYALAFCIRHLPNYENMLIWQTTSTSF